MPFFSIITICFNNLTGLRRTVTSVLEQTEQEFELIIIDGASTDGTLDYLRHDIAFRSVKWTSEPDHGIYDAMNKGLLKATGGFIIYLNSGDVFHDRDVLRKVRGQLRSDDEVVYGNAMMIFQEKLQREVLQVCDHKSLHGYNNVCHQAIFFNRRMHVSEKYDTRFRILGDHDLLLRLQSRNGAKFRKIDLCVCNYETGGISMASESRMIIEKERLLVSWQQSHHNLTAFSLFRDSIFLFSIHCRMQFRTLCGVKVYDYTKRLFKLFRIIK